MLPQIAPVIADALSDAKLVTISGGENGGAAASTTNSITGVIQTVLAAQLVSRGIFDNQDSAPRPVGPPPSAANVPSSGALPAPGVKR
jgi:flotillin